MTPPDAVRVYFATCNGRVVDAGYSSDNLNRRAVQMFVNRNNASAARHGDDSKPYAVVTYAAAPR